MKSVPNFKKIKVVWLCHFANDEIINYFESPQVNEFAPWISKLMDLVKGNDEIELHIVAPNVFTNTSCGFIKDGINYHFYKVVPISKNNHFLTRLYNLLQVEIFTNFYWIKRKIHNIVQDINPDIIHLHGAENSYYSAGILSLIDRYPVLTTIQGFIRNTSYTNFNINKRIAIEEDIIKRSNHIGVRTNEMSRLVKELNPSANLHFHNYPLEIPTEIKENIGKDEPIDCLFFARVEKDKGIEDLIESISIIKKSHPNINVKIIGSADKTYLQYLNDICAKSDIRSNVKFLGFLPAQEDIYPYILKSKMCVLPSYHDILPGTILISMFMKLPVVAYAVGGIPELNNDGDNIILVNKQDVNQLSKSIIMLLENDIYRKELAERAYIYAFKQFNNNKIIPDIFKAYREILKESNVVL